MVLIKGFCCFSAGGKVDGIVVSEDNLLLEMGTQEVTGVKRFGFDVSVAPTILINGLVNGVDLVELLNNTVSYNSSAHRQ